MEFQITALLFITMVLHLCINISESMINERAAKKAVRKGIKRMIRNNIRIEQHHFNELADREMAKAQAHIYVTHMIEGLNPSDIQLRLHQQGLSAYGRVYDRIRSHSAMDLIDPKREIANMVDSKKFINEEMKQQYIDKLAKQKTDELRKQEYESLIKDGYPLEAIHRLLEQRGLLGEGSVYEELRQPFEPRKVQSMDLAVPKAKIEHEVRKMKISGKTVSQSEYDKLTLDELKNLRNEFEDMAIKETGNAAIAIQLLSERGLLDHRIFNELRMPSSSRSQEEQATKRRRFFERGEGSSSRP